LDACKSSIQAGKELEGDFLVLALDNILFFDSFPEMMVDKVLGRGGCGISTVNCERQLGSERAVGRKPKVSISFGELLMN